MAYRRLDSVQLFLKWLRAQDDGLVLRRALIGGLFVFPPPPVTMETFMKSRRGQDLFLLVLFPVSMTSDMCVCRSRAHRPAGGGAAERTGPPPLPRATQLLFPGDGFRGDTLSAGAGASCSQQKEEKNQNKNSVCVSGRAVSLLFTPPRSPPQPRPPLPQKPLLFLLIARHFAQAPPPGPHPQVRASDLRSRPRPLLLLPRRRGQ